MLAVQGGQTIEWTPFDAKFGHITAYSMPQNGGPCFRKNRDPYKDSLVFYILIKAFYHEFPSVTWIFKQFDLYVCLRKKKLLKPLGRVYYTLWNLQITMTFFHI